MIVSKKKNINMKFKQQINTTNKNINIEARSADTVVKIGGI